MDPHSVVRKVGLGALAAVLLPRPRWEVLAAPLAGIGLAVVAILEAVSGGAAVEEPPVSIAVDSTPWGAWLGGALALVAATASVAPLLGRRPDRTS